MTTTSSLAVRFRTTTRTATATSTRPAPATSRYFAGTPDDAIVGSTAVTSAQVAAHHEAGTP